MLRYIQGTRFDTKASESHASSIPRIPQLRGSFDLRDCDLGQFNSLP